MFRGSYTALITPFKGGAVDERAFQKLVDWQIAEGTHGLVPVGTTGETPTLSHEEHKRARYEPTHGTYRRAQSLYVNQSGRAISNAVWTASVFG